MSISPDTRDRLTASIAQLVRTGRHVSTRAAAQLYGELPSFGWTLLLPARAATATSAAARSPRAPASTSPWPAGSSPSSSGPATSSAAPTRATGGRPCSASPRRAPRRSPRPAPLRADWALAALSGWDEHDARRLTDLLDRLRGRPRDGRPGAADGPPGTAGGRAGDRAAPFRPPRTNAPRSSPGDA